MDQGPNHAIKNAQGGQPPMKKDYISKAKFIRGKCRSSVGLEYSIEYVVPEWVPFNRCPAPIPVR